MPDTPENQAESPQSRSQKPGVGLPIARGLAVLSLGEAAVLDVAVGPYSGQETGETALLRTRLDSSSPGDLPVADRDFCSTFLIALLLGRGVQSCTRMHQKRHVDFRRGRRLGPCDHLLVWTRPQRPRWMDQTTYDALPETLELRELRFDVDRRGYRTAQITIATTLTDAAVSSKADIAELYVGPLEMNVPQIATEGEKGEGTKGTARKSKLPSRIVRDLTRPPPPSGSFPESCPAPSVSNAASCD